MPIITFWSSNEKTMGQTVSATLAATTAAIEYNQKVLLISADFDNKMMERSFGAQESNKELLKGLVQGVQMNLGSGIQGLLKLVDSNRLTPETIQDYTKIVFKNRLEVLYSPNNVNNEKEMLEKIKTIITNAARYYDQVYVDLKKGLKYSEQLDILDLTDVVVLNVDQRLETIEKMLENKEIEKIRRKRMWNICKYDKKSKYNSKNLSRKILKNERICEIDYNTLVLEATQEGGIPELMLKFRTLKEDDDNLQLLLKTRKIVEEILMKYKETRAGV